MYKHKRISDPVCSVLNAIHCVKKHGNWAAKLHFAPSATEKICEWRKQVDGVEKLYQNKHSFHMHATE
jgi:hypothetical protein